MMIRLRHADVATASGASTSLARALIEPAERIAEVGRRSVAILLVQFSRFELHRTADPDYGSFWTPPLACAEILIKSINWQERHSTTARGEFCGRQREKISTERPRSRRANAPDVS
jgi:hypothetical protein